MAQLTAQEAYDATRKVGRVPHLTASSFVCAACGAFALHQWGLIDNLYQPADSGRYLRKAGPKPLIAFALCSACQVESIFVNGNLAWPRAVAAPAPSPDLPALLRDDYEEARRIAADSPRGAAALLRLVLEHLCPLVGATKPGIDKAIGELVATGKISPDVQQALDAVRVIGNEAVHPGELDLKDDSATVNSLFGLINYIVEKTISDPKKIAAIYGGLPASKLAGIAARDAKASKPGP